MSPPGKPHPCASPGGNNTDKAPAKKQQNPENTDRNTAQR
jgi:hypothetical protein